MGKITRVLFSDIEKVATQYVGVPHQQLKPHEVRVVPVFYGICGSDLHVLRGGHPFAKPPVVPGHEIAAHVTETGSGVKNMQPGDHVVVNPTMICMEYRVYRAGRLDPREPLQVAGFHAPGSVRSQRIVPARNCHVVPASLPLKMSAFAEPAACARHCINRMPRASLESVLVIGAGTMGLLIVQALHIMGAGKITVIEPDAVKHALALKLGATEVQVPGKLAVDVRLTGAVSVVAAQTTLNDAYARVYAGGTVVYTGILDGSHEISLLVVRRFERDLLDSGMYISENLDAVIEWLADGWFDTNELITDLFTTEDAAATFERAQQNDPIKVILQFAPR